MIRKKQTGSQPKVVLLENVKGFLTSHKGQDAANTVKNFSDLGYIVDIIELDAVDFTPQSRPRVFFIAVQESVAREVMRVKPKESVMDGWWADFDSMPDLRSEKVKSIIIRNEELNWGLLNLSSPKRKRYTACRHN